MLTMSRNTFALENHLQDQGKNELLRTLSKYFFQALALEDQIKTQGTAQYRAYARVWRCCKVCRPRGPAVVRPPSRLSLRRWEDLIVQRSKHGYSTQAPRTDSPRS